MTKAQEDWLETLHELLRELGEYLPAGSLENATHLLDHNETSVALEFMAYAITSTKTTVPARLIRTIRAEISHFPEETLPANLDDFADE